MRISMENKDIIDLLNQSGNLSKDLWMKLLSTYTDVDRLYAASIARDIADKIYGKDIYIRGLIEFTNHCKNDCYYCGIRASNRCAKRYRLEKEDILECCENGYNISFSKC